MTIKFIIHYGLHILLPLVIAFIFFPKKWKIVLIIFLSCFLVDLDHLLATPIFQENRCSIGFHPLHSYVAIAIYFALLLCKKVRIIAIGLLLHMLADFVDCLL